MEPTNQEDSDTAMTTQPTNNNVLIEVIREYAGVSRTDENESLQRGKLIDFSVDQFHLTASAGVDLGEFASVKRAQLVHYLERGAIVRWEQYAEGGQTFEEDGQTYALVPWWRLISVELPGEQS